MKSMPPTVPFPFTASPDSAPSTSQVQNPGYMNSARNRAPETDPAAPARGDPAGRFASARRILIVDDEAEIRNIMAELLRGAGYHVDCAADGGTAWAQLCAASYDLLITDHLMAGLTGLDLLRRIRTAASELPVILISGDMPWEEPELLALVTPGGALEKPFSFPALLGQVRALLAPQPQAAGTGAAVEVGCNR